MEMQSGLKVVGVLAALTLFSGCKDKKNTDYHRWRWTDHKTALELRSMPHHTYGHKLPYGDKRAKHPELQCLLDSCNQSAEVLRIISHGDANPQRYPETERLRVDHIITQTKDLVENFIKYPFEYRSVQADLDEDLLKSISRDLQGFLVTMNYFGKSLQSEHIIRWASESLGCIELLTERIARND